MSGSPNNVIEVCKGRYDALLEGYANGTPSTIVVSHFGEFSQELVNTLSNTVEEFMFGIGDKKGTIKRVFSILVEGLQNIRLHGERDDNNNQASFFIIAQDEDFYRISCGNLILNDNVAMVREKIESINAFSDGELKEHYMEVLTNGIISNKGGAGLGFITMAMKSKNKLDFLLEPVNDDFSCFSLTAKIARSKK